MKKLFLSVLCFVLGTICLLYSVLKQQSEIIIDNVLVQEQINKAEYLGKMNKTFTTEYGEMNISASDVKVALQNEVLVYFKTDFKTNFIKDNKITNLLNKSTKLSNFINKHQEKIEELTNLNKSYYVVVRATPYLKNSTEIYLTNVEIVDFIPLNEISQEEDELISLLKNKLKESVNHFIIKTVEKYPVYKIKTEDKEGNTNWKMKLTTLFLKDIKVVQDKIIITVGL